jgi:undecaprenyl-diphosphatase
MKFNLFLDGKIISSFLNSVWGKIQGRVFVIGVIFPLIIFSILAFKVNQNEGGFSWDIAILLKIHSTAQPFLDQFAKNFTNLGNFGSIIILILPLILVFIYQKKWALGAYLTLTIVGNEQINNITKIGFHRLRPHLWESIIPFPSSFSFPSGHAMGSMTLVVALLIISWRTKWRVVIATLGFLYVILIGWTRLYLGVHFPSDILGGWLLGITWSVSMSLLFKIPNNPHISE